MHTRIAIMNFYFPWEESMLLGIQEHLRNDFLTPIMKFITMLGDKGIFWIIVTLALLIIPAIMLKRSNGNSGRQKALRALFIAGIMCAIAFILSALVNNLCLKHIVDRTRPYELINGLTLLVDRADDASFPSGHAAASFSVATVLLFRLPKKFGVPAFVLAAIIAFSRLYVGIHFPTDVLVGTIDGIVIGCISIIIGNKFAKFIKKKRFPAFIWY